MKGGINNSVNLSVYANLGPGHIWIKICRGRGRDFLVHFGRGRGQTGTDDVLNKVCSHESLSGVHLLFVL